MILKDRCFRCLSLFFIIVFIVGDTMSEKKKTNEVNETQPKGNNARQSLAEKLILFAVFIVFAALVVSFAYNWNYVGEEDSGDVVSFQYTTSKKTPIVVYDSGEQSGMEELVTDKININTATLDELDSLPGIGPSKAQAIIDYRDKESIFTCPEDIKKVSGIGDKIYEQIKDKITVE